MAKTTKRMGLRVGELKEVGGDKKRGWAETDNSRKKPKRVTLFAEGSKHQKRLMANAWKQISVQWTAERNKCTGFLQRK